MTCVSVHGFTISLSRRKQAAFTHFATSGRIETPTEENGPDGSSCYMRADEYLL